MLKNPFAVIVLAICPLLTAQEPQPGPEPPNPAQQATNLSVPPPAHTLLDGTPVKLRLSQTITSASAKVGQEIPFEVVEDVSVDQVIVLPKGAVAIANVTSAEHKKSMGRGGKLDITISYARLKDQEKVALRASQENKGGGHVGAMTGAIVASAIVFFPAAPLFLFIHGKDITIPQGTEVTAFVEGDMHLNMANFGVAPPDPGPVPSSAAPAASASIAIDSTPPGADIEVDGAFVGNTPSSVTVAPGSHQIVVKKKGFTDWTKTLNVTGGAIHLNADLEQAPAETPVPEPAPAPIPPPPPPAAN